MKVFALSLLFGASIGCGGAICEPGALRDALSEAAPGDTVQIGNCRVETSVSVPAGVRLEGLGPEASSIMGSAGTAAVELAPGADLTELASLTVESAGPLGILARGAGRLRITDVDVRASLGVGIGIEDVSDAELEQVSIRGIVDTINAVSIPIDAAPTVSTTYGLAIRNVGSAQIDAVTVRGFSEFGAAFVASTVDWSGGGAEDNRQAALFVEGGSIAIDGVDVSRTFKGFRPEPSFGAIFVAGASVSTDGLIASDGAGIGILHVSASGRHVGVQVANNREEGVRVESTTGFELTGEVSDNRIGGVVLLGSSGVSIHDATIARTQTATVVLPGGASILVGDGIHLIESAAGAEIRDLVLDSNQRIGLLIELAGAALSANALGSITVSGTGTELGVIAQGGTPPPGWDGAVTRNGDTAANDAAFTGQLDRLLVTGPCDYPAPEAFEQQGIVGITGL